MNQTLRDLLAENRDVIVSRFVAAVREKELAPEGVSRSLLRDHIPVFLDEVVAELDSVESVRISREVNDQSAAARQHGHQRFTLGYDVEGLIREYGVLRHVILELARESGTQPSFDEFDALAKCLSVGVAQAASEYVRHRDQLLEAQRSRLQFLAQAGELLSSSLDYRSTLRQLTELLVPQLADWCAVHLDGVGVEDMSIVHVDPAKADVVREIYRRYPISSESVHGARYVVRTNEPQLMPRVEPGFIEAAAKDEEHLEMLRMLGACSWMILPLRVHEITFGALTFVYGDSGRHYDEADLAFAGELARRAAMAIHNSALFEQSQKARARAEAERRAKDEFVSVVSHELRTPLNAILGWSRLLQAGSLALGKQGQALEIIERNAVLQTRLVVDLLDMSAATTGQTRIQLRDLDLAAVVQRALAAIDPTALAKAIQVDATLGQDAFVRGDDARLQQAVWIVVSNAVKFSPRESRVAVRVTANDADVELSVEDQGIGIASEFLPFVFDSFRQYDASNTRRYGGMGVGLSIAKHLVELHGGSIEVQSEGLGKGARCVIRLPAVSRGARDREASVLEQGRGLRVLVVDADFESRDLTAEILKQRGMEVQTAEDAGAAMILLESGKLDMVVADIAMPVLDGLTFIHAIRASAAAYRDIPAIALSLMVDRDEAARAIEAGFQLHVPKPVEAQALVEAVLKLVPRA